MARDTSGAQVSTDGSSRQAVKSAERALAIIEHVSVHGGATFAEVIESLGLPRSSTHGLVRTLVAAGWLEKGADRRFSLGSRAWEVGQRYGGHRELVDVARPLMERITAACGETVQLAQLDGIENVYIAISHSPHPIRLASSVGVRLPAHATGIGKALLSLLPPEERERRLAGADLARMTARTITDAETLLAGVGIARAAGFATDDEEYLEGCACVAVPVGCDPRRGMTPVALSVTVPTSRMGAQWPEPYLPLLREAAAAIRGAAGLV